MATNSTTAGVDHATTVSEQRPAVGIAHPTVVPENYDGGDES